MHILREIEHGITGGIKRRAFHRMIHDLVDQDPGVQWKSEEKAGRVEEIKQTHNGGREELK
jgi:hypothetical protein